MAQTSKAPRAQLTSFAKIDPENVNRTTVRWDPKMLESILHTLWQGHSGIRMPYNVYTHRMISALRQRFDRRGWTLRAQTELESGTVALWIKARYRGARPRR